MIERVAALSCDLVQSSKEERWKKSKTKNDEMKLNRKLKNVKSCQKHDEWNDMSSIDEKQGDVRDKCKIIIFKITKVVKAKLLNKEKYKKTGV